MSQGELRQADPDVPMRHRYSLPESELLARFFPLFGEVSTKEINAVTARATDVSIVAYGVQPG